MTRVFVVWDDSHLWGLLVLRYLRALGLPHQILRAHDIAEGALSGKCGAVGPFNGERPGPMHRKTDAPSLLIVPGGWARGKALRLGEAGLEAIRGFVARGGSYLGFCGGAGLALTSPRPSESLGLCPWGRMGFAGRLQHFLSGDVRLGLCAGDPLSLPGATEALAQVWWPGQFAPPARRQGADGGDGVQVLARYAGLGPDFWVADLALSRFPEEALSDWENLYGLQVRPDFLTGRPAVISGQYGAGRYVLSYPHLETPDSPQANAWLAHLLAGLTAAPAPSPAPAPAPAPESTPAPTPAPTPPSGHAPQARRAIIPPWHVGQESAQVGAPAPWPDAALSQTKAGLEEAIGLGQDHLLLFWRNPWLLGWRRGVPGPGINSVYALVCEALSQPAPAPGSSAELFWREHSEDFARLATLFCKGLSGLLLAERLDMTVRQTPGVDGADDMFSKNLRDMRSALFGPPPAAGGVCGQLLGLLEELCARLWEGAA
ncbi:BPL-N domain-containing protein [Humidesulfovibrio sp.]